MSQVYSTSKIGKKLQKLRKKKNLSVSALADAAEITRQHVYHIENGERGVSLETLASICAALQVEPGEVLSK